MPTPAIVALCPTCHGLRAVTVAPERSGASIAEWIERGDILQAWGTVERAREARICECQPTTKGGP